MGDSELDRLNASLDLQLGRQHALASSDVLKHLAALVKSEIIFRWMLTIDVANVTDDQRTHIPKVLAQATWLKGLDAGQYLGSNTMQEIEGLASQLRGVAPQQPAPSRSAAADARLQQLADSVAKTKRSNAVQNALGHLVDAWNSNRSREAEEARLKIEKLLAEGGSSGIQADDPLWRECLTGWTSSMDLRELTDLNPLLERTIVKGVSGEQNLLLVQMVTAVKAELFYAWLREFGKNGVNVVIDVAPDYSKLTPSQREKIRVLVSLATFVQKEPFANSGILSSDTLAQIQVIESRLQQYGNGPVRAAGGPAQRPTLQ